MDRENLSAIFLNRNCRLTLALSAVYMSCARADLTAYSHCSRLNPQNNLNFGFDLVNFRARMIASVT